jgi:hypothetical protein
VCEGWETCPRARVLCPHKHKRARAGGQVGAAS